jgi:DNA-binding XRE family transcriptional regulator
MPASKRTHTLAILRKNLALRQPELAEMVGCSVATIQSIEVGRLKLSESLAGRISVTTGCDRDWLLRNDVSAPMPPRPFFMKGVASVGLQTYVYRISLLADVFSRLFAECRRLDKSGPRGELERLLATELETLRKTDKNPNARPLHSTSKENFQYFEDYPWELPEELKYLLDLGYLIETSSPLPREPEIPPKEKELSKRPRKAPRRTCSST